MGLEDFGEANCLTEREAGFTTAISDPQGWGWGFVIREITPAVSQVDNDTGIFDLILDILEGGAEVGATTTFVVETDLVGGFILDDIADAGISVDDHNLLKVEFITRLLNNTRNATHEFRVHRTGGITDEHQSAVPFILISSNTDVMHSEELAVGSGTFVTNTELTDILAKDLFETEWGIVESLQLLQEVPTCTTT